MFGSRARTSLFTFAFAVAAFSITACKSKSVSKHAGTDADPFVIGMSQCNLGEPWRVQMKKSIFSIILEFGSQLFKANNMRIQSSPSDFITARFWNKSLSES